MAFRLYLQFQFLHTSVQSVVPFRKILATFLDTPEVMLFCVDFLLDFNSQIFELNFHNVLRRDLKDPQQEILSMKCHFENSICIQMERGMTVFYGFQINR